MNLKLIRPILISAVAISPISHAQSPVQSQADGQPSSTQSTLGEIIVTAQKRSERIQDVPISITAVTGSDLARAGVSDVASLAQVVPGLTIQRTGAFTEPSIRGITTTITVPGADANVAIYVDGVYQSSQLGNAFEFPDISRVEVLKGPQGTLFGRNATGGAIQFFTLDPSLTATTGQFAVGAASFHDSMVKAYVSTPLIKDVLAVSLTGYSETSDSYNHNIAENGESAPGFTSRLLRGKILFEPSSDLKFVLTAYDSQREDPFAFEGSVVNGNTQTKYAPGVIIPNSPYEVSEDPYFPPLLNVDNYGGNLRAELNLGAISITSITAYYQVRSHYGLAPDFTNITPVYYDIGQPAQTYSQEFNVSSNNWQRFNWVAGAFYYNNTDGYDPLGVGPDFALYAKVHDSAYAIFAEGNYKITDQFTAILGGRESYEVKSLDQGVNTPDLTSYPSKSWTAFTPRASLEYALTSHSNIYGTFSEGFKSGTFNPSEVGAPVVNPEKIDAYEIGAKYSSGPVHLDSAVFYYNYRDLQVQAYNGLVANIENAASSEIYGLDLDGKVELARNLLIDAGLTWTHARYIDYPYATVFVPLPIGGSAQTTGSAAGDTNVRAPEWTAKLAASYLEETSFGNFNFAANVYYSSKFYFEPVNRLSQGSYAEVNVNISYEPPESKVKFTVWGKNLNNATVIESTNIGVTGDAFSYAPPRTVGVQMSYDF